MANGRKRGKRKFDKRMERNDERRFDSKMKDDSREARARNDVSWYAKYPDLLQAAGSFPYPYRPGMSIPMGTPSYNTNIQRSFHIPGVLALDWIPSIGVSNEATSPSSVAAKEIYAKVRSKYSGALDADAPDFMVYLMALDSVFAYIAWCKRIYRTLNAWTPNNYVLPDTLLSAYGLTVQDIQSLREQRVLLWQIINELVLQSRKFTCPALMDVFNRHYWLSDNVYTDANSINAQLYVFNLGGVYQFANLPIVGDSSNTAAGLKMISPPTRQLNSNQS